MFKFLSILYFIGLSIMSYPVFNIFGFGIILYVICIGFFTLLENSSC